jgi:hypothetical protein
MSALVYMGVAAFVAVLLAVLALWQRTASLESDFPPTRLFPALTGKLEDVALIQIQTKSAAFNVTRNPRKVWVLPDKSGYPADFEMVRKTILALAELDAVERRTARPDWHERLGLGLPKKGGSGVLVTLKDGKGKVLASVITGQSVEGASAGGRQALYVRRPSENQTYVALGDYFAQTDQSQWLDKAFIDFARDRIKTAAVKPFEGRAYSVTRAKPEDENFRIVEALPRGRILRTEGEPNGVGNALLGLSFDDVVPASKLNFAKAARAAFVTFDGLTLSLSLIEKERDFWLTINAVADPRPQVPAPAKDAKPQLKPDVAKEAKDINRVVAGWAYKIPRYKGVLLTSKMEDLLKPVGGAPPGPSVNGN